jgi:hypothetical protein
VKLGCSGCSNESMVVCDKCTEFGADGKCTHQVDRVDATEDGLAGVRGFVDQAAAQRNEVQLGHQGCSTSSATFTTSAMWSQSWFRQSDFTGSHPARVRRSGGPAWHLCAGDRGGRVPIPFRSRSEERLVDESPESTRLGSSARSWPSSRAADDAEITPSADHLIRHGRHTALLGG